MEQESVTQTPSLGPGSIAQASVSGGPAFALSATEWISIQTYVIDALVLPTTLDALKTSIGSGAPSDMSDFSQLVAAYGGIHDHVTTWQNDTFPQSVSLASDIHNYAQQAPTYYNPILPLAQKLTANPDDQTAKDELTAILGLLSSKATEYQKNAASVAAKIKDFADQTQSDKVKLSGTDGKGGLQKYYNDKYGATSTEVITITEQLKAEKLVLDAANADYNHDVIVAATTPTYAWVWPIGTVAAAIVAGIYGDKAVKALERVRAAQQQINSLSDKLAADANLMIAINSVESGLTNILGPLNAALPIIQKIQGVWGAIADDLNNIINLIKTNIQEALPIIMNLGVQSAINAWTAVGQEADAYRVNAYVTVNK
ncbi:alpha-xenorhabdolysin family binary toxin subunit A [Spirosoma validum]|uniref:Alpha-xenorhabdolysin family binary toxin subunit A n=1 Tax=Spirosoma validum TaxID=2771355 RepID=A0A927GCC8_9BACT|nr:alpha-xenorhabdolysin family binary toxin subunit A [Spirosoma validum]MBD2752513.1 alpha-xenorhabdolysin family binary toxin subunit A [Spirosoma validum]